MIDHLNWVYAQHSNCKVLDLVIQFDGVVLELCIGVPPSVLDELAEEMCDIKENIPKYARTQPTSLFAFRNGTVSWVLDDLSGSINTCFSSLTNGSSKEFLET